MAREPNIQNIPIRTEEGRKIREALTRGMETAQIIVDDPIDTSKMIFVFGSNEAGIHGAGAAKYALRRKDAVWGRGLGLQGLSYGIPTKDHNIQSLPLDTIQKYVEHFLNFAKEHPELTFQVTAIGCGLAGFQHGQIAPMFRLNGSDALPNLYFDEVWSNYLCVHAKFWGTF